MNAPATAAALPLPGGPLLDDPVLAGTRRAASVIVMRDAPAGPQVLLLRRAVRDGDMRSGVWVFPGGVLDPADPALRDRIDGPDDAALSDRMQLSTGGLDYAIAAVRECFEEVGLLLAHGRSPALAQARAERAQLGDGAAFAALVRRLDLRLAGDELAYQAHWLTPLGMKPRFDTRFFLARAPQGQEAVVDAGEALELAWLTPAEALAAQLRMLPVTRRLLQELSAHASVAEALVAARQRPTVERQFPRLGRDEQGTRPVLPQEPAWAEIGRLDAEGRGDVWITLAPERAVTLSARVQRITCANGSMMTGPGTNTYLIGAPGSDALAVLDPGPDDAHTERHLQAVLAAAGPRRIAHILVTHTHKDHSPAVRRLQALTGARVVGLPAAHPEWQDTAFAPDEPPHPGQRWLLGPDTTLRAVHTPGHAANHICWWLEEEALLFTGDHVMQGSTVVINPPDGDMAAYLASLQHLQTLPLQWLAPGHGFLMAQPQRELARLVAHRLGREAKVLQALQAQPAPVALAALLPQVYGDVPTARHAVAERSLWAHLRKLEDEGRAAQAQGRWCATVPAGS
ncbi:MBL fold metallo-hydrolase [Ideonella sp. B7]|uniref:MBL fold metallo-hydrolase n=1 Tax=Ideonella benzenivorans TaxID=2831643 RepID=UPI001CEDE9A4|nr:MBL fold metallo-hydrolase [Ideonella benzenivorans]MCA6218755.1 MBL fold metallo-hydrolase [Ideonella benzenivorans]